MSPDVVRHLRSGDGPGTVLEITPASVGWRYLSFQVLSLVPGETVEGETAGNEIAIVPLGGSGWFRFGGETHPVSRTDVFTEKPHVAYLPPSTTYAIGAVDAFEVAFRLELEAFFRTLTEGGTPTPGPEDALETLRLAVAARRSWRDGRPVRLDDVTAEVSA